MEENKIMVTVCCLAYNHEKYIRKTLDGILMQKTTFPIEAIIHDDCSTDNTKQIIEEYHEKYPNIIKPIYEVENQYSKCKHISRKFIYPKARGKYIAICECDDWWTDPEKLQRQVEFLEKNTEYSAVYHAANIETNGKIIGNTQFFSEEKDISIDEMIRKGGGFCATLSLCFRKEYALDYPKFREIADVGDYPMQILLAIRGKVRYFPQIMGVYNYNHDGSWSNEMLKDSGASLKYYLNEVKWMKELNCYTERKWEKAIYRIIIADEFYLFKLGQFDGKTFVKDSSKVSIIDIKWKLRARFIVYHPWLYTILRKLKVI